MLDDEEDLKESSTASKSSGDDGKAKGMILPFESMTMTFHDINYYVDMPKLGGFPESIFFKDKEK